MFLRRSIGITLLSLLTCVACSAAFAQMAAPSSPAARQARRAKSPGGKNVKMGHIAALDSDAGTITINGAGDPATYALTTKTHCWRNKRAAETADFKAGDEVVLHIRNSSSGDLPKVTEMADPTTWNWLRKMHRETTVGTLKAIEEGSVTVTVGAEAIPLTYTVTEKTLWSKGGKEAGPDQFKAGEAVAIVPRALPSGGIGARVVADSAAAAAQAKERLARIVSGVVQSVDRAGHTLTLQTKAGATRTLPYTEATSLQEGAKTLPIDMLKTGQLIRAHLKRSDDGEESVTRIQITIGKKRLSPAPRTSAASAYRKAQHAGGGTAP